MSDTPSATLTISQDDLYDISDCCREVAETNKSMGDGDTAQRLEALAAWFERAADYADVPS